MPIQIKKWVTVDNKEFNSEIEALRHEILVLNKIISEYKHKESLIKRMKENNSSSYGSSGGGGHD